TSVADVVAWADAVIAASEHPHWSFCELAMMGGRFKPDVASALREVPGVPDSAVVQHEIVRMLARGLAADRTYADRSAFALYRLAMGDRLPDRTLRSVAWWAWDALSLADEGIDGETRDQVIDKMLDALQTATGRQPDAGDVHRD
ncbi:MAG: hypothetical protein V2A73_11000, partial [Pseudomonadota bacterium]